LTLIVKNTTATAKTGTLAFSYSLSTQADAFATGEYALAQSGLSVFGTIGNFSASVTSEVFDINSASASSADRVSFNFNLNPFQQKSVQIDLFSEGYASAVPEPASIAAVGLGLCAIARRRRRS
jgi:hypothetical protein